MYRSEVCIEVYLCVRLPIHRPHRAAICRASGCRKFRDDSYEEAYKSREMGGYREDSYSTRIAGSLVRYSHGSQLLIPHTITNTFTDSANNHTYNIF